MNKHHPYEMIFFSIIFIGYYYSKKNNEIAQKYSKHTQTQKTDNNLIIDENEISRLSYEKVGKYLQR